MVKGRPKGVKDREGLVRHRRWYKMPAEFKKKKKAPELVGDAAQLAAEEKLTGSEPATLPDAKSGQNAESKPAEAQEGTRTGIEGSP